MIQHPAVLALIASSLIISGMMLYACRYGTQILKKWDARSGSELQLYLERRTYLISALVSYALIFQIFSLFLFIFTADELHGNFTGAMCAAGTLNLNGYGYPALGLKVLNCILAGVWLIINHVDTRGYDYPLIKVKYALLAILAPLSVVESTALFGFFGRLKADVITSCCGSLFGADSPGIAGEVVSLPHGPMEAAFAASMVFTLLSGIYFYLKGRGGYIFSALSIVTFIVSAVSLVSFICLYYYELPTHHCPFCILQREYGYAGYILYAALLAGVVSGAGMGALMPFRGRASLGLVIPAVQRKLAAAAVTAYLIFTVTVLWRIMFSSLRL